MKLVTKLGIRVFELRFLGAKGKLKKKVLGELKCRVYISIPLRIGELGSITRVSRDGVEE